MARFKNAEDPRQVVFNWMSAHYTIDFLAVWEQVNNPDFNRMGFHTVKNELGRLLVSVKKWVEATNVAEWHSKNPETGGNIRDNATPEQLVVYYPTLKESLG